MFMRVRRTVPQFTFILSERFVNPNSSVSTGFFRFFLVLFESGHNSTQKTQQNKHFLFFQRLRLVPVLSQHYVRNITLIVLEKLNLCIKRFRKELRLRLCEHRKTALPRSLRHEMTVFHRHHQAELRRQLIRAPHSSQAPSDQPSPPRGPWVESPQASTSAIHRLRTIDMDGPPKTRVRSTSDEQ